MLTEQKQIVIDVDGVLLDIHKEMEHIMQKKGYTNFYMQNVRTYDLNKSCPEYELGAPRDLIMEEFHKTPVFDNAKWDMDAIRMINNLADTGLCHIIIYSASFTENIKRCKEKMLITMLHKNNIELKLVGAEKQPILTADAVIEDCIDNLYPYPATTQCYLINKPYNRLETNPDKKDLLTAPHLTRCKDACEALQRFLNYTASQKG